MNIISISYCDQKKNTISKKINKTNELGVELQSLLILPIVTQFNHAQVTNIRRLLACSHQYKTCQQNAKFKRKENQSEVEIKPSNFYIYAYEPSQKLAYIRDKVEMRQLPKIRSSSFHWKLTQRCNRSNENSHLKLLAKVAMVLTINCILSSFSTQSFMASPKGKVSKQ